MSLNSLQDEMSRRAASMAAMAQRMNNPQELQSLQQRLVAEIQSGSIKPYVGIPLVQELTQKLNAAKAHAAQQAAGAGMPPAQGSEPLAQQVMQQAAQEDQGVETLPSNLPESYAGGGIVAFANNMDQPVSMDMPDSMGGSEIMSAAGTQSPYVGRSLLERMVFKPEEPEWKRKLALEQEMLKRQMAQQPPAATKSANVVNPAPATIQTPPGVMPQVAAPGAGAPMGGNKIPGLTAFAAKPNQPWTPEKPPEAIDYASIVSGMDKKQKEATEKAIKASQAELEAFDKPGFETREELLQARKASQEKDLAMTRAMNLMSLGFGIAGSKERTLAGALGNEGRQGIQSLIQGEAASRAAKEKLEDARDNFEQQKVAAKKGNYQTAQTAGQRAGDDVFKATQLDLTAKRAGGEEALQRTGLINQSGYQAAHLAQTRELELQKLAIERAKAAQQGGAMGIYNLLRADPENKNKSNTDVMSMATRMATGYDKSELGAQAKIGAAVEKAISEDTSLKLLNMQLINAQKTNDARAVAQINSQIQAKINQHKATAQSVYGGAGQDGQEFAGFRIVK
jgi:hypothetical protein